MKALSQTQQAVEMIGTKLEVVGVAVGALMEQMGTIEENKRRERKMSEITNEEVEEIKFNIWIIFAILLSDISDAKG